MCVSLFIINTLSVVRSGTKLNNRAETVTTRSPIVLYILLFRFLLLQLTDEIMRVMREYLFQHKLIYDLASCRDRIWFLKTKLEQNKPQTDKATTLQEAYIHNYTYCLPDMQKKMGSEVGLKYKLFSMKGVLIFLEGHRAKWRQPDEKLPSKRQKTRPKLQRKTYCCFSNINAQFLLHGNSKQEAHI